MKLEKIEIAQSDLDILKLMIKYYEERGGGYSQKEALKLAIRALKAINNYDKHLPSESELHDIWFKNTDIEISLTINKGLKAIYKRINQ